MNRYIKVTGVAVALSATLLAPAAQAAPVPTKVEVAAEGTAPRADITLTVLGKVAGGLGSLLMSSDYNPLNYVKMIMKCGKIDPVDPACAMPTTDDRLDQIDAQLRSLVTEMAGLKTTFQEGQQSLARQIAAQGTQSRREVVQQRSAKISALFTELPRSFELLQAWQECTEAKAQGETTCGGIAVDDAIDQRGRDFVSYTRNNLFKRLVNEGNPAAVAATFTGDAGVREEGLASAVWRWATSVQNANAGAEEVPNVATVPFATPWLSGTMDDFLARYRAALLGYALIYPISEALEAEQAKADGVSSPEEKYRDTERYIATITRTINDRIVRESDDLTTVDGIVRHYSLPELEPGQIAVAAPDGTSAMIYSAGPFTGGIDMTAEDFAEFSAMVPKYAKPSDFQRAYPGAFASESDAIGVDGNDYYQRVNGRHRWYTIKATTTVLTVTDDPFAQRDADSSKYAKTLNVRALGVGTYGRSGTTGRLVDRGPLVPDLHRRSIPVQARLTDTPTTWKSLQELVAPLGTPERAKPLLADCQAVNTFTNAPGWCGVGSEMKGLHYQQRFDARAAKQPRGTSLTFNWHLVPYSTVAGLPYEVNYGVMGAGTFVVPSDQPVAQIAWINRPAELAWPNNQMAEDCPTCSNRGSQDPA